ncbi:hypothetical protein C9374_000580 [Naegleria lovaniensis]|uniref:DNA topoisomerase I n=1 Tax=Naegleria lovaniensis TaxID=51637 RepID=A0AA88GYN2_NAELO|nr:uncharacterized protein C9374_000580 [Naegleria lovaniensis]KAG2388416.1 hypothetical protein C9374_000580 [Naegleria lovaniensis]
MPADDKKRKRIVEDDDVSEEEEVEEKVKIEVVKKETKKKKESPKATKKEEEESSSAAAAAAASSSVEDIYKWWQESDEQIQEILSSDQKWNTLKHNGVLFPPDYEPHGIPVYYDGKPVKLTPEQEEVATMYASMLESDYVKKQQFNDNFWSAWKELLGKNHTIKSLGKCDFSKIWEHLLTEKEKKNGRSSEEKKAEKEEKAKFEDAYKYALVDGRKEKVQQYKIEPPALFRGRGTHPKMGQLKKRIQPEDITINIGRLEDCPPPPVGHKWGAVVSNNTVLWLAAYKDVINNKNKYVQFASGSSLKAMNDYLKYQTARNLKDCIEKIREDYKKQWTDSSETERQLGVAIYFIDKLALRVGNEKDDEEEADTVGCCSLRVEHITLTPPSSIKFDFLGKDSIRYENTVEVEKAVYKCVKGFIEGKKPADMLFNKINPTKLNEHLKSYMEKLSAKVFRTYNASITLDRELKKLEKDITTDMSVAERVSIYNSANRQVAILCNHQRAAPKTFDSSVETMDKKIESQASYLERLKKALKDISKSGYDEVKEKWEKDNQKITKNYEKEVEEFEQKQKDIEMKAKNAGKSVAAFLGSAKKEKAPKKPSLPVLPKTTEAIESKIEAVKKKIEEMNHEKKMKIDNKTVALSTSRLNYCDPRITVAWCKRTNVPIQKLFSKTLQDKFPWALDCGTDFTF